MSWLALARLALVERRRRIAGLLALAALFLAAAAASAALARDPHGGYDLDRMFTVGGYPLVSAALLAGWLLGRFPLVAVLVLCAGVVSGDRASGQARLYAVRPGPVAGIYLVRLAALGAAAFLLSALLLPLFDLLLLGRWAGPATLVLILAYVLVYGGLTFFLSVWTRGDAWIAVLMGIAAIIWHALLRGGLLGTLAPGGRQLISMILPPHGALFGLESAFANVQPIPWDAFGYCAGYGLILLALGAIGLVLRET